MVSGLDRIPSGDKTVNLYHAARRERAIVADRHRPAAARRRSLRICFWECACAAAFWNKLVGHWTGQTVTCPLTRALFEACTSRQVHRIPEYRAKVLADQYQDNVGAIECVWRQLRHVLATICQTRIWVDMNAAMFKDVTVHITSSISRFWALCLCQLRAIAKRAHRKLATATHDALLYACIELLERDPRGPPLYQ